MIAGIVVLVTAIGFTRPALGVHYLSNVLVGWLLGLGWLAVTAATFHIWRRDRGLPAPSIFRGLEPEAARSLAPTPDARKPVLPHPWWRADELLTVWVLLLGILLAPDWLITDVLSGTVVEAVDTAVVQWFVEHRTPTLTRLSDVGAWVGGIVVVTTLTLVSSVLFLAVRRQGRPPLFGTVLMAGEVTLFLRDHPASSTARANGAPPRCAARDLQLPSGHLAATICLYGALSAQVVARTRSRWRWLVVAVALVVLVAFTLLYRGVHYPTDRVGSVLLAVPWLLTTWWVLHPRGQPSRDTDGGGHERP